MTHICLFVFVKIGFFKLINAIFTTFCYNSNLFPYFIDFFFVYIKENGKFLALDLGGTNFRVILLELDRGKITNEVIKMYEIYDELRVGGEDVAVALFDHIGQCLCDFVEENDLVSVPLPLGK